jgi:hypothetical protein
MLFSCRNLSSARYLRAVSTRAAALLVSLALSAAPAAADPSGFSDEPDLSIAAQYPLLIKILQFDRNLTSRTGQEVVIGVIYQGRFRASKRACDEMRKAAQAAGTERVGDRRIDLVAIDIERMNLEQMLDSLHVDVAYVAPLRATDIKTITDVTRDLHITTVTGVEEYVHQGLAVGLGVWQEKPRVFVNLEASRAEGADFSSRLLSLAEVVK